jgi:flagellar hook-associated protein 2
MGFITSSVAIRARTSDGAKSNLFGSSIEAIGTLLELSNATGSTTVQIGGNAVDIDLSVESLTTIAQKIDALAGISASVVTETVDGETLYRIDISGTTSFTDNGNVLQTLGILEGTYGTVAEVHTGTVALTDAGDTLIDDDNGNLGTNLTDLKIGGTSAGVQNGDTITISGKKPDGTSVSSADFTVGTDGNTLQDLMTFIEDRYTGEGNAVTVSFEDGKITVTSDTAGDSQMEISLISNNENDGILDFGEISMITEGRAMQIAAGEDAEIEIDNVVITDSSNTVTDVIEGVTLNLVGEDTDTTVTVKVERDLETIKSKINDMADAYNAIMNYINTQFSYDNENGEIGGTLFGDGTLSSVKSGLINAVTQTVIGVSSDFNRLPLIGISLDISDTDDGSYENLNMSIDEDMLTEALETNFDDVKKLLIAYGSSSSSNLEYISHTSDTQGGAYDVNITQAATRTTVTGSGALSGVLGESVTVSVADYKTGRVAEVELDADMDIDDVVNALNSEFSQEYTEQLQGSENTGYSYSTLFSGISGAEDGDVITFSGTKGNGLYVSGSYTVDTTKTLGDLAESIEDMFEDEVTVALDANGKLIITDRQAGDSQLSFTINTSEVDGLNFGTVGTTTEGRYAMTITASEGTGADAGKLVLTHNAYGTGHILEVSQESTGDPLGLDDAVQVYGKDVAGTINGLTATGTGRTLTLDSEGNNANGLSISYSGSGAIDTSFTLTLGIAEILDRLLDFITDTSDGYVTYKQTSLQGSIDSFKTQIEDMEARLDREMDTLTNQFLAMELALSELQTQSEWLSGQIKASLSGWS